MMPAQIQVDRRTPLRARHRLVLGELAQRELRARQRARGWRRTARRLVGLGGARGTRPDAAVVERRAELRRASGSAATRSFARARSTTASSAGETVGLMTLGGDRRLADVLVGDRDRGVAAERRATGEQLVEHDAGRVQVGAGVDRSRPWPARARSTRRCRGSRWSAATVVDESDTARAMPKSMTFTWPVAVTMTLPGLMSRCTTPARCEYSSAVRMPSTMRTARDGLERPVGDDVLEEARRRRSSMTMNGTLHLVPVGSRTVSSPASKTRTIVGCAMRAAACASWRNRVRNAVSVASCGFRSLIATWRPRRVSDADVDVGHAAATDELTDAVAPREQRGSLSSLTPW